eukprot:7996218-Alexandrium_andersonii.AAC.1
MPSDGPSKPRPTTSHGPAHASRVRVRRCRTLPLDLAERGPRLGPSTDAPARRPPIMPQPCADHQTRAG